MTSLRAAIALHERHAVPPSPPEIEGTGGVLVLVDLAPRRDGRPVAYDIGVRIAELAEIAFPCEYLATFDRVALVPSYPRSLRRCPQSDRWSAERVEEAARALLPSLAGRRVILLGRRVSAAFHLHPTKLLFEPNRIAAGASSALAWIAPHPSSESRWWLDRSNAERAREFFRNAVCAARITKGRA